MNKNETKHYINNLHMILPYIIIVFMIIFFVGFFLINYANKKDLKIYEVVPGEIVNENKEEGFIFRTEQVVLSNDTGYVTYYAYDDSKIKKGSIVCTVSKNKKELDLNVQFLDKDYKNIKNYLSKYSNNYASNKFDKVYDYSIKLNKFLNEMKLIRSLDNQNKYYQEKDSFASFAPEAGIVSYYVDGYEGMNFTDFKEEFLKKEKLTKTKQIDSSFVESGEGLYKIVTEPEFKIIFTSENNYDIALNQGSVRIKTPYSKDEMSAKISTFLSSDGKNYYMLTLDTHLEDLIENRIIDFSIITKRVSGLKIPIKSILYKNCYMIPKDFLFEDPLTREKYLLKKNDDKKILIDNLDISKEDEQYLYLDTKSDGILKALDNIISWDQRVWTIREVAKMPGVYNINKGYSVFKHIELLDKTSEYAIVKKGINYSLASYDHIVLDQSNVIEGDLIS